jgi:hypothetical protein
MIGRRAILAAALAAGCLAGAPARALEFAVGTTLPLDSPSAGDFNGVDVGISGDTAIVGGHHANGDRGWAEVFVRNGGQWQYQATLTTDDSSLGISAEFGSSVAIDGDTAVVGAHGNNTVYVFNRAGEGVWNEETAARLQVSGAIGFGNDVQVSGDRIIVGAWQSDLAYVFSKSSGVWDAGAPLFSSEEKKEFGRGVGISGDNAVVGDPSANTAYLYHFDGTNWVEESAVTRGFGPDAFGFHVSIDGDYAVVGSGVMDVGGSTDAGSASIYHRELVGSAHAWVEQATLVASDAAAFDEFGSSVSISGDLALIGAQDEGPFGGKAGSTYLFKRDGSTWTELAKFRPEARVSGDEFGHSAAIDDGMAVIGAWNRNAQTGAAYVLDGAAIVAPIPGDANLDGEVDDLDASILGAHWQWQSGGRWAYGDFNADGKVTDADAAILAAHWGEHAECAPSVPEPTAGVLIVGLLALLALRRR